MDWLNNKNTVVSIFVGAIVTPIWFWLNKRKKSKTTEPKLQNLAARFVTIFEVG